MNSINDISFKGKRVLIRVDFNVPLDDNFNVLDDSRILASKNTIEKIIHSGGKAIIMSHLGRPENGPEKCFSLQHIVPRLSEILGVNITFVNDCVGKNVSFIISKMNNGDVVLLENLRFYFEEKNGDKSFANRLAKLGDIYVNDAFGAAHRNHASTAVIADFFPDQKYFGYLFASEISNLKKALNNSQRPFTAIIGGAKISGKIEVIRTLLSKVDNLIIGGGMAYTFVKALGGDVGLSLIEKEKINLAKSLIEEAKKKRVSLLLPVDSINADEFKNDATIYVSKINKINPKHIGLDIGEKSISLFSKTISLSKTIIWNGPMGVFEMSNFSKGTRRVGESICEATKNGAFSLVGGGESVAAIKLFGLNEKVSYVSTGGGAMLEYLEGKELPGIIAVEN